jgi:Domain of unknown function (DUF4350)
MRSRLRKALRLGAIALIGLGLGAAVVDELTPSSSGPASSSYATSADGLAGYAELLTRAGHGVARLRVAPARAALDPRSTVVLLDPNLVLKEDVAALRRFVVAGGWLIAGGPQPGAWLSELIAGSPDWAAGGSTTSAPIVPLPQTAGVDLVQSAGEGQWSDAGATLPVIGGADGALLTVQRLGAGRLELLADPSPLQNRLLASADNAQLGLALAGPASRPIAFEEASHGYGASRGLAALPTRWKWALAGLVLAALLAVAARFRRLGPAAPTPAEPPPPRRVHVEAIASALARTGRPADAARPVHDHLRALVLRRSGLPPSADPHDAKTLEQAASQLGLDSDEIDAVVASELDEHHLVSAGTALAKLSEHGL